MNTLLRRVACASLVVAAAAFTAVALTTAPQSMILAAIVGALTGVSAYAATVGLSEPPARALAARARAVAGCVGGIAAGITLAIIGMTTLAGDATAPLLLLTTLAVAACSWSRVRPTLTWFRTRSGHTPPEYTFDAASPRAAPPDAGTPLTSIGTPALCAMWQRTYHRLPEVRSDTARDGLVDLRRRCLEEFERRDPAGTARWLALEPRPAGTGPHHHLHSALPLPPAQRSLSRRQLSDVDPNTRTDRDHPTPGLDER